MDAMWQEYGMEELEKGMQKLFPASRISVAELMGQLLQGDVLGAAGTLLQEVIQGMGASAAGRKNILIWLIVLGILSALLIHFVEVFTESNTGVINDWNTLIPVTTPREALRIQPTAFSRSSVKSVSFSSTQIPLIMVNRP